MIYTRELAPTGRYRYRVGWWRRMILQVEILCEITTGTGNLADPVEHSYARIWRDARVRR